MTTRRDLLATAAIATAGLTAAAPVHAAAEPTPAKFQLGLVTYNLAGGWELPALLKVCQNVGIAAVECRTTHKHGVEPSLTAAQRQDVKKRFADAGVKFWGCGSICEFHAPDVGVVAKNVETCKQFVQLVADLGGTGVKVRPNGMPKDVPAEKTLTQIAQALSECGKAAADAGVEIWVEVHGPVTQLPANMKAIMEKCNHPKVGLTWNSNPTDVVNGSVASSFALLQPYIRSCHINELYKDAVGTYPYRELFRLLAAANYDRYTLIEVAKPAVDVASGEELLRYYKALWTNLCRG
jgi:sugar phosphate isomerase/epimerase